MAGKLLDQAVRILGDLNMKGLGIRDWGLGSNARVTLASLILLTAISACGGGNPPQEQAAAPPPAAPAPEPPKAPYYVYVTNEIGGDLTVIDGGTNQVVTTIPLGKRPRGIKVSPDGTKLFVALSGSPMAPSTRPDR
jgi:YVTN family beta-propeller protein